MDGSRSRGQATIGYALVVGIALIGTITVLALGATALTQIQSNAGTGAAEQAMTQFDSQTSQVALGGSDTQTVDVGQTGGTYEVDPDAGYVRVVHINFDGDLQNDGDDIAGEADSGTDDDRVLYQSKLGAVLYQRGGTTIGYQSGGVWRKPDRGQSRMVSPPEFHYRGSTLTFPIVRVNNPSELPAGANGVQSGSGAVDLQVTQLGEPVDKFPTKQDGYPDTDSDSDGYGGVGSPGDDDGDGDGGYYENPAEDGTVVVYIQSEFYRAWAEYFRDRTDGKVDTTDDAGGLVGTSFDVDGDGTGEENVVAVELLSTGLTGPFDMPSEGSSINVRGVGDHSLSDFSITLVADTKDEAQFDNLQWSMYAREGDKRFEMYLKRGSNGGDKCNDGSTNMTADLDIYYSDDGGDTYHGWHVDDAYAAKCEDVDDDGDDEIVLEVDFVDDEESPAGVHDLESGDPKLEYVDKSGMNNLVHFDIEGSDVAPSTITLDGHSVSWESKDYDVNSGDTESVDRLVNHYLSEITGMDLTVDDKGSDTISEDGSSGRIEYIGADQFITYIHLSENDVRVKID